MGGMLKKFWYKICSRYYCPICKGDCIPNALTVETIEEFERGEGVHEYENFEEFLKER